MLESEASEMSRRRAESVDAGADVASAHDFKQVKDNPVRRMPSAAAQATADCPACALVRGVWVLTREEKERLYDRTNALLARLDLRDAVLAAFDRATAPKMLQLPAVEVAHAVYEAAGRIA